MPIGTELDIWSLLTILGLALITLLTRSFFLISEDDWRMPRWVERGLEYAPIAALAAVVIPEVAVTNGTFISHWWDPKLLGSAAALVVYYWKKDVLYTIAAGMAVYLPLHIGLGW